MSHTIIRKYTYYSLYGYVGKNHDTYNKILSNFNMRLNQQTDVEKFRTRIYIAITEGELYKYHFYLSKNK